MIDDRQGDEEVLAFLRDLLHRALDIPAERVRPEEPLAALALASLDWVEVQIELEMRYGVRVEDGLLKSGRLRTVADLLGHVRALRALP